MNNLKRLVIIPFCLVTACTPPRPPVELPENKTIPVEKRKAKIGMISSWEIRGAMAAKSKTKGWSATMNWVQEGINHYQIHLMGPLGSGAVVINQQGNTITIQDGAKRITSHNPNELLAQQTGIKLPVNNLYYWVRGLPAPGSIEAEHHDQYNHLDQLKQNGYTINFTKYTSVKGVDLPSTIHLQGNGVMVKVIIQKWTI